MDAALSLYCRGGKRRCPDRIRRSGAETDALQQNGSVQTTGARFELSGVSEWWSERGACLPMRAPRTTWRSGDRRLLPGERGECHEAVHRSRRASPSSAEPRVTSGSSDSTTTGSVGSLSRRVSGSDCVVTPGGDPVRLGCEDGVEERYEVTTERGPVAERLAHPVVEPPQYGHGRGGQRRRRERCPTSQPLIP
ncbi:MAG: hypothetical protein A07HB70_02372 [uncultured archaeon A07HB70]|nr:MAG: hypothetical protein A07HB70_02372 [uncultured archaeon A07HB70]